MKDGVMELAKRNGYQDIKEGGGNNRQIEELEEAIYQIQEGMKYQNGYNNDDDTIKQVKNFIDKVEKMGEVIPREEKVLLIAAAERLQGTINRETIGYKAI
jgi:hypothetical protein